MNTHHGVSHNGGTALDIDDITRISYGIGNRGIAATLDLARFDLSGFAELLVCLAREIVDPDSKNNRDWFAPYILKPNAIGRTVSDIDYLSAFIAMDIDAAGWTINRITDRMERYAFIAYTTTKSRPDHQRWRVIAFLSRDYTVAEHAAIWSFLNEKFDKAVDASTKDASRISYAPAQWVGADNLFHQFSGIRLDVDDILKTYQSVGIKPTVQPITELPGMVCLPDGAELITPKMIAEFASAPPGGRFYRLLCAAASRCRMNSWSISAAELCAAAMAVSSTDSSGKNRHDPMREAERALAWPATNIQPQTAMERLRSRSRWHLQH